MIEPEKLEDREVLMVEAVNMALKTVPRGKVALASLEIYRGLMKAQNMGGREAHRMAEAYATDEAYAFYRHGKTPPENLAQGYEFHKQIVNIGQETRPTNKETQPDRDKPLVSKVIHLHRRQHTEA